jgi:MerR family transcriptional regulator, light-induced transcriptional regulator
VTGDEDLSLPEAAAHAGLHYMTLYRYVRTGRIPATRDGREWRVTRRDLDALRAAPAVPARDRTVSTLSAARRLEARILAGDEPGAWRIVEDALASGAEPATVLLRLLVPSLASVGERWARGEIRVADEHRASAVAGRLIGPACSPGVADRAGADAHVDLDDLVERVRELTD